MAMENYKPFGMLLDEVQAAYETEKNLKNEAYLYIIQKGLFNDYGDWKTKYRQGQENGNEAHSECVAALINTYCNPTAATGHKKKHRALKK